MTDEQLTSTYLDSSGAYEVAETSIPHGEQESPPAVLDELNQIALRVIPLLERTATDIFEIGRELLKAKALLPHGGFGAWHKEILGLEKRTAENFMQVAKRFKSETIALLAPLDSTSLYQLAAPSTPDTAIEEVLARTELGEAPSIKEVKALIQEHKNEGIPEKPPLEQEALQYSEEPPPVPLPAPPPAPTPLAQYNEIAPLPPPAPLECGSIDHWQKIEDDEKDFSLEIIKFIECSRSPALEMLYCSFAREWRKLRWKAKEYLEEAAAKGY